ncbi:unnamed protein product [Rotaria sp. Silwood2]|nr:unnamed protein product [Rotaria sp. Silwood2]CAF2782789.1 unnamed protein product [Rotaria sp. Silwood2]CAF3047817.1 unnamed protein product [Rotaria sp. Silwood2]CAF3185810.1 unnamed protein product [Rotaria sp. Silwood2]CAF4052975.1 unnamed protein product [Rotaria sp. Silwood2]
MTKDISENGSSDSGNPIRRDANTITNEAQDLIIEVKSNLVILICGILSVSLLSLLLSAWLAKTISNTPSSIGTILSHYFGFDRNETEPNLTWWTPLHIELNENTFRESLLNKNNSTIILKPKTNSNSHSDHSNFHRIVLPLVFIGAILLAIMAYYARVKCTARDFTWGAVPKIPLGRVDPKLASVTVDARIKTKQAEPGVDYTIVQGTKKQPVVFALVETLLPLKEECEPGVMIDEGTQYELKDIPKIVTRVSSAPDLQTISSAVSISNEQEHVIELLQREPLPTILSLT